jgi:DNA ligase-associated metallophosphoesterase
VVAGHAHADRGRPASGKGIGLCRAQPPVPAALRHARHDRPAGGDSFHDQEAAERLADDDADRLRRLTGQSDWVWLCGNHDPAPPATLGGRIVEELAEDGLVFRHQAAEGRQPGEVSGHFHPKASVVVQGKRLTRRCFVSDGIRLVLPAFGAYAGGLDVLDRAFAPLFNRMFHAWLLGDANVFAVPRDRLAA